jgi:hypothetical protein
MDTRPSEVASNGRRDSAGKPTGAGERSSAERFRVTSDDPAKFGPLIGRWQISEKFSREPRTVAVKHGPLRLYSLARIDYQEGTLVAAPLSFYDWLRGSARFSLSGENGTALRSALTNAWRRWKWVARPRSRPNRCVRICTCAFSLLVENDSTDYPPVKVLSRKSQLKTRFAQPFCLAE